MSSAISPTTTAVSSNSGNVTAKEIGEYIKYFQQTHKAIVTFAGLVNKLPANQPLQIGDHTIRRSDVNKYSQAYMHQLGDLRKIFTQKKKRATNRSSNQLNSLFYISDQLVNFYKNANLGPLDPENPKGEKLADHIDILLEDRMSTSGILTSLISRYIETNKLKSAESSGRFAPDKRMEKSFSTTKYVLNGKSLSKRTMPADTPAERAQRIKDNVAAGSKSAFDRVSDRVDRRSGKSFYDEDSGLLYTAMMVFNNFYRIPPPLLNEDEKSALTEETNVSRAKELQEKLSKITSWKNKKPVKA